MALNGSLLYSRKKTGEFPNDPDIVNKIKDIVNQVKAGMK